MTSIRGGVTFVPGFLASGVHAGIKKSGELDLALIVSQAPSVAAGCFTKNRFKAAPLLVTLEHIRKGRGQAVIVNSGNANACTGRQGYRNAQKMVAWTAGGLHLPMQHVFAASTGVVSEPLPMEKIRTAIPRLIASLSGTGGSRAARAILTTDTFPKEAALKVRVGKVPVRFGAMAKGAGMVHPQMATMLAFITTDAVVDRSALRMALRAAVAESFNCLSVDGETSTNDMVLCLANGLAQNHPISKGSAAFKVLTASLTEICRVLAQKIVGDGEGATKFVTLEVRGGRDRSEAHRVAEAIARSILVKTALYGEDPNWGRVLVAIGACGVPVPEERVSIWIDDVRVVKGGVGLGRSAEAQAQKRLRRRQLRLTVDLGMGAVRLTYYTTDLSEAYVRINASYRT